MDPRDYFAPATYGDLDPMDDPRLDPRDDPRGDPLAGGMGDPMGGPMGGPLDAPMGAGARGPGMMYDPIRDSETTLGASSSMGMGMGMGMGGDPRDPLDPRDRRGPLMRGGGADFPRDDPGFGPEPPLVPDEDGNEFYPRGLYDDEFLGQHREPRESGLHGVWTDDGRMINSMLTEPHPMAQAMAEGREGVVDYTDPRRPFSDRSLMHSHPSEEVDDEFIRQRNLDPDWSPRDSQLHYDVGRLGYRPRGFYDDPENNPDGRYSW